MIESCNMIRVSVYAIPQYLQNENVKGGKPLSGKACTDACKILVKTI
jgi:hypothetical protein